MRLHVLACVLAIAMTCAAADTGQAQDITKRAEVPFRADSGLIEAEYLIATGNYAAAVAAASGVLQRHPSDADAYTYRGYAYQQLGDSKKAAADYRRALTIAPTHLGANRYLAGIYVAEGDMARALEQMQVIRMTCGAVTCAELTELEAEINRARKKQQ